MKGTIRVTESHILSGLRGSCGLCPIARAIREQVPNCTSAAVGPVGVQLFIDGEKFEGELPPVAAQFVAEFDGTKDREDFSPFTFDIYLVPQERLAA